MVPALRPLILERGTKRAFRFALKESATGPAIDLTGSSFTAQIRRTANAALSMDLTVTVESPATDGIIQFIIDDSDFDFIPSTLTEGVYDVLWTQADGMKPKLLRGPVTVNGTATQPA